MTFILREAIVNDVESLVKLGKQTFFETFSSDNTKEDMDLYLSETFTLERLRSEFEDANVRFFVIEFSGDLVGYVKLRNDYDAIEVERLYVLKEYQNKKLGKKLMEHCIEYAKKLKKKRIWLGVWEKNLKAIEFYKHFGFTVFGSHVFVLGKDKQNDLLIEKALLDTAS